MLKSDVGRVPDTQQGPFDLELDEFRLVFVI